MGIENKLIGRNGKVFNISGKNNLGIWYCLNSKGYKYQR